MTAGTAVGFRGDPPVCVALIVCETFSIAVGSGKVTIAGLIDRINLTGDYPVTINATAMASFTGVLHPFECEFSAVAYPPGLALGVTQLIGRVTVELNPHGPVCTVISAGTITFPATCPGLADVRVHGNGVFLGSRPVLLSEQQ